ncbi:contact-dependent growth inhibition system immunity protein [Paractinoplanes rhizophilus]|uniref:Contact-dependent growth inhibition system immunity protein n=1 Tax=Paractinoplanes rhizophilus TaxID=1416877 RepID=A0ABW2HWX6_9ACTN
MRARRDSNTLVPLALDQVEQDPLAEGDFYPGDLLDALIRRVPDSYWAGARRSTYARAHRGPGSGPGGDLRRSLQPRHRIPPSIASREEPPTPTEKLPGDIPPTVLMLSRYLERSSAARRSVGGRPGRVRTRRWPGRGCAGAR